MMEKEAKKLTKKKPDLGKLLERVELYKKDCIEMATLLSGSKLKLEREFDELRVLLTTAKREEIRAILSEASEFYKRVYKKYPLPHAASSPSGLTSSRARRCSSTWRRCRASQS